MLLSEQGIKIDRPIYTVEHAVEFIMKNISGGKVQ
jgi:hypothetical protein